MLMTILIKKNRILHSDILINIVNKLPQTTDAFSEYEEIADIKWIPIVDVHLYNWAFKHDEIIMNILENW